MDLAAGLEELVDEQYTDARGDRGTVNNVAVLIMGSRSANAVCKLLVSIQHSQILNIQCFVAILGLTFGCYKQFSNLLNFTHELLTAADLKVFF